MRSLHFLLFFLFVNAISCETDNSLVECSKDDFRSVQCRNKGKCMKSVKTNEYRCLCDDSKYTGALCEMPLCVNYCYNNGKCIIDQTEANRTTRRCLCDSSDGRYSGDRCQFDKCSSLLNTCPRNCVINSACECLCNEECDKYYCNNQNGTCYQDTYGNLACKCRVGFSSPVCYINDCSGYCFNGGTCVRGSSSIYCECPSGYEGKRCSKSVVATVPTKYRATKIVLYLITLSILISLIGIGVYYSIQRGYFRDLFKYKRTNSSMSSNLFINHLETHEPTTTSTSIRFKKFIEENEVNA